MTPVGDRKSNITLDPTPTSLALRARSVAAGQRARWPDDSGVMIGGNANELE